MVKDLKITLKVDAKTGEVKAVKNSFDELDRKIDSTTRRTKGFNTSLLGLAGGTAAVYGVARAFSFVTANGWEYNKSMDASKAKLTAMVSASKGYALTTGEEVSAMERKALVAAEVSETMGILEKTNAETAKGMSELVDIYALAKPGMDRYKWALEDQIEVVKLASNTASTFDMTAQELSTGIDDLAAGTWIASSGFGKMMKSVGVSKEEFKAAGDKVAYLKDKLKETGAAQDTHAVAVSNFTVEWDKMSGKVTAPVFDPAKEAIKALTTSMGVHGPKAAEVFADSFATFSKFAVSTLVPVAKAISMITGMLSTATDGFAQLMNSTIGLYQSGMSKLNTGLGNTLEFFDIGGYEEYFKNAENYAEKMKVTTEATKLLGAETDKTYQAIAAINISLDAGKEAFVTYTPEVNKATESTKKLAGKINDTTATTNKSTKAQKAHTKSLKDAAKEAAGLHKEYLELTGQTDKLFELDAAETLTKFANAGYSGSELSKIYDGMWESFNGGAEDGIQKVKTLSEALGSFDSGFGGLFDGIASGDIGSWAKGLMGSGLDMIMPGLGSALGAIGSLFSSTVSQAEIDASKGRVEFSDDSLKNLESVFESAQYPMLDVTKKMHSHLRNMDANFYAIAREFSSEASSGGIDLTGANFVETMENGFLGFSSKTVSLIGTGLEFELQNLSEMMNNAELDVRSYTTTLVEKSSWWGLRHSSSIQETYKDLPSGVVEEMAGAFTHGYEAIMVAGVSLGLNEASLEGALDLTYVDLGKIDFTGLSEDEIADRMNQAFSTAFSGVVDQIPALNALVDRYVQGTEESLETLGRIAVEYDQSSHMFSLIEKDFSTVFSKTLINVIDGMEFYMVEAYTMQEQMLDIVKSTGGLTEFQDAMAAFMGGFYTETEQVDFLTRSMEQSFSSLGLVMPDTSGTAEESNARFRALTESIDTSTEEGTYLYGQVLLLAEGFHAMTAAAEALELSIESVVTTLNDEALILRHTGAYTSFEQASINRQGDADASALYAINAANAVLQDTVDLTGIYSVNADNYLARFEAARYGGLTDEQLSDWVQLGSAITALENAADSWEDAIARESEVADKEYVDRLTRAYTGNLSHLDSFGRADYFTRLASVDMQRGDSAGYLDNLERALEQNRSMSATVEDYGVHFEKYIQEVTKNKPKKTTDDLYIKMNEILAALKASGHATTAASFQKEFTS